MDLPEDTIHFSLSSLSITVTVPSKIPVLEDSSKTCVSGCSLSRIGLVKYHKELSFHVISSNFLFGSNFIVVLPPKLFVTDWHPVRDIQNITAPILVRI